MRPFRLKKSGLGGSFVTLPPIADEQMPPDAWLPGTIDFEASSCVNAAVQRHGKSAYNSVEIPGIGPLASLYKHYRKAGGEMVFCSRRQTDGTQTVFKDNGDGVFVSWITGFSPVGQIWYCPFSVLDEDYVYITEGINFWKTDGSIRHRWGNAAPISAMTGVGGGAGLCNGTIRFKVRFGYGYTEQGIGADSDNPIWGWSNMSGYTEVTVANQEIILSSIPVGPPDSAVVWRQILATEQNQFSHYYILETIRDNVATTLTVNFDDYQLTHEVDEEDNSLPPPCDVWVSYKNRLFGIGSPTNPDFVFYSKHLKPDCFDLYGPTPAQGIIRDCRRDDGARMRGLCSFEDKLLLMSETKTYRLIGDGPFHLRKISDYGCVAPRSVTRIGDRAYWMGKYSPVKYDGNEVVELGLELKVIWDSMLNEGPLVIHAAHRQSSHWWMLFVASCTREVKEYLINVPSGDRSKAVSSGVHGGDPVILAYFIASGEVLSYLRRESYRFLSSVREGREALPNLCMVYDYVLNRWYPFSYAQACSYAFDGGNDLGEVYAGENASGIISRLNDPATVRDLGQLVSPRLRLRHETYDTHNQVKRFRRLHLHAYYTVVQSAFPGPILQCRAATNNSHIFESPQFITLSTVSRLGTAWFTDDQQGARIQLDFTHSTPVRVTLEQLTGEANIRQPR